MDKGVIIFSVDDGRWDMYRLVKEILIAKKVPATLNITTSKEWFEEKGLTPIVTEEFIEIAQSPFMEIANHADKHSNEYDDIRRGFEALCELLGYDDTKPIGFASPYSQLTMEYANNHIEKLQALGIKYVRTCDADEAFNKEEDVFALTSYAVKNEMPVEALKNMADKAAENKNCLIYLFHSVLKPGEYNYENDWSYDFDKFNELVDYILQLQKDGKVHIMTTADYVNKKLGE